MQPIDSHELTQTDRLEAKLFVQVNTIIVLDFKMRSPRNETLYLSPGRRIESYGTKGELSRTLS